MAIRSVISTSFSLAKETIETTGKNILKRTFLGGSYCLAQHEYRIENLNVDAHFPPNGNVINISL